jgi:hypothetical protein
VSPNTGVNNLSYTARMGGTSAACPQVAAVAALVLSINPNLTQQQVFNIITATADQGTHYTYTNGISNELGYGRLNACRAVSQALSTLPISGPTTVCSSGSAFTVNNLPAGCTITWIPGPNLTLSSVQGSNPCTFTSTGTGSSWISATLNSGCGSISLPDFPVSVRMGAPSTPGTLGFRRAGGTCYYEAYISPVSGADSYDWSEDNINWSLGYSNFYGLFEPNTTVTVYVRARNDCGVSGTKSKTKTMGSTPPDCMWKSGHIISDSTQSVPAISENIRIYPNPAESEITVCVSDESFPYSTSDDEDVYIRSVTFIDSYGKIRKIKQYNSGLKSVAINISDLPKGFYFIRVNNNITGESYKLLIH